MTSNQIIHMSRLRAALREIGHSFDPKVAAVDLDYLQQALVTAMDHPNADVQESALVLAADFGLAEEMRDVPFESGKKASAPTQPAPTKTTSHLPQLPPEEDDRAPEPSALVYTPERQAVIRKYVGGLR